MVCKKLTKEFLQKYHASYNINFSNILGTVHCTATRQASFSHKHKENRLDRRCVHYTQIAAAQQEEMGPKVSKVVFDKD